MSLKKFFLYLYLGVFVVALIATAYLYVKQKKYASDTSRSGTTK
jgi:hypothetical protein